MAPSTKPQGVPGTSAPSGYLTNRDRNREVTGPKGYGTPGDIGEYLHAAATEPAVASCLSAMVLPIARGEWSIGADDDADEEVVEFVRKVFFEELTPDFRDIVRETSRAMLAAGFHVHEPLFRRRADGSIGLRTLAPRPAWTVSRFIYAEDGELQALEQQAPGVDGRYRTVTLPAADLLIFTHDREGTDPTGKSIIRPVVRDVRIKDYLKRLISVRNEKEAVGVPIGTYPTAASDGEKDAFEAALAGYRAHERSYIMVPEGFSVTIPEGKPGSSDALRADAAYLTVEIQSVFLQAWQSLGQSGSSSGGRAVGEVQADPYYLALEAVMSELCGPLDKLLRRVVDLNFGPQEHYPYFVPPSLRVEDVLGQIQPILEAIKAGGVSATVDVENVLRERLKLDEKVEEDDAPTPPVPPVPPGGEEPAVEEPEEPEEPEVEEPEEPAEMKDAPGPVQLAWLPPRNLSKAEQRCAFGEMSARFDASSGDLQNIVGNVVRQKRTMLLKWLRPMVAKMVKGNQQGFRQLASGDVPRAFRKAVTEAVADHAADLYDFGRRQADRERRLSTRPLRKPEEAEVVEEPQQFADPPAVEDVDAATIAIASVYGDKITDEVLRAIRLAAVRAVESRKGRALTSADVQAILDEVNAAIEQLAVSSAPVKEAGLAVAVQAVAGGRSEVFDEHADEITSVEYSAVMDGTTCEECRMADGQRAENLAAAAMTLPPVPNPKCFGTAARCRCIHVVEWKDA